MNELNKDFNYRVYFIGIGGISMSALAKLTHQRGNIVAGSDFQKTHITKMLPKSIKVFYGHNAKNIKNFNPNYVVYTGAIKLDNPELNYAIQNNIKVYERADYLGLICNNYKNVIAVSGTHGKTTTTAMLGEIFVKAKLQPTIHVGGEVKNLEGNLLVGKADFFITEACEYKKSFEKIKSSCAVVTNIEQDHMDCYLSLNDLKKSFVKFLNNSNIRVIGRESDICDYLSPKQVVTCGYESANYVAQNLVCNKGSYAFDVFEDGKYLANFKLNTIGEYNVKNALCSIAVARQYNISIVDIYDALRGFNGVLRRNERMGEINNIPVYADYCHHPTEVKNCISAFKKVYKKIYCIFQPHTYSRTKNLIKEFSTCFKGVKLLNIYKTYSAREEYLKEGSETTMYNSVKGQNKLLTLDKKDLLKQIKDVSSENFDCILVLTAGDIYEVVKNELFK